jgi:hypothetical protein
MLLGIYPEHTTTTAVGAVDPQPKLGVSRAKTQAPKENLIPNLGVLASWYEEIRFSKRRRRSTFIQEALPYITKSVLTAPVRTHL